MNTIAPRATNKKKEIPPVDHPITHAALVEYLASGAVTELVAEEFERGAYRLTVSLSWRTGKCMVVAARGGVRTFRSLDTMASFLLSAGVGRTVVRLELKL